MRPSPWLGRYAAFTALATLGLVGLGGLVTSHGVGMAVPDWPTTYGYNMFLFPVSKWVGGVFYEHTHRLWASAVGLLTVILATWMQMACPDRRLVRWGWVAVLLVCLQGLLGGLRVSLMRDQLGIFHAALAQGFLVLLALLALVLSAAWKRWAALPAANPAPAFRWAGAATLAIFAQLVLGATMRHQHAGLAVPDFPLAHQQFWPPTDDAFLQAFNAHRTDARDFRPITAFHVQLHMAHRVGAVVVLGLVMHAAAKLRRAFGCRSVPGRLALVWSGIIVLQGGLGAWTVLSNKAADIATFHVVLGAVCLVLGAVGVAFSRAALRRPASVASGATKWVADPNEPLGALKPADGAV